jgi:hypothetical protein
MRDEDGVLTIPLGNRGLLYTLVLLFFLSFGALLLSLFAGTIYYAEPGETPGWSCLAVGLPWTLLCLVGLATREKVEIDGRASEARRVVTHFGIRRVMAVPASGIARVGVTREHQRSGAMADVYRVRIETRTPAPFLGGNTVWNLHAPVDPGEANADAQRIADRLGVPATLEPRGFGKEPGT